MNIDHLPAKIAQDSEIGKLIHRVPGAPLDLRGGTKITD